VSYQKEHLLLLVLTLIATMLVLIGAIFKNDVVLNTGLVVILIRLYLSLDLK